MPEMDGLEATEAYFKNKNSTFVENSAMTNVMQGTEKSVLKQE